MSKRINVKSTTFNFDADVIIRDSNGMRLESFGGENIGSKNTRDIKRYIVSCYADEGITVNASDIMVKSINKVVTVHAYKINASNDAIVSACIDAGLDVFEVNDNNDDTTNDDDIDIES